MNIVSGVCLELGQWMKVNGEAIYAARPWKQYGEGPTTVAQGHFGDNKLGLTAKDLRFTRSKNSFKIKLEIWGKPKAHLDTPWKGQP